MQLGACLISRSPDAAPPVCSHWQLTEMQALGGGIAGGWR